MWHTALSQTKYIWKQSFNRSHRHTSKFLGALWWHPYNWCTIHILICTCLIKSCLLLINHYRLNIRIPGNHAVPINLWTSSAAPLNITNVISFFLKQGSQLETKSQIHATLSNKLFWFFSFFCKQAKHFSIILEKERKRHKADCHKLMNKCLHKVLCKSD